MDLDAPLPEPGALRSHLRVKSLYYLQTLFRWIARQLSPPAIWLLMPAKLIAWRTQQKWLRRLILEITTATDFAMVFANTQNVAMLMHQSAYDGNFVFGKALMVVDHPSADREIRQPTMRGSRFMGIDIVSNDSMVFLTNAGPIAAGPPTRDLIRGHIDNAIMTPRVRSLDPHSLKTECEDIIRDWSADDQMAGMWQIRGAVTRVIFRVLADVTLPKKQADEITYSYARHFVEFSLFGRYLPSMLALLGTREGIRRDAYIPLRKLGIDGLVIDMTLFAAMFSVGTIVMKCVGIAREQGIQYEKLGVRERMTFVIESLRLNPTVTTVHRIVEEDETVLIRGREINVGPGDELAYPFACINRDASQFANPGSFRLDRPASEVAAVLSWSAGPHACPAKDLSILTTVLLLDALAARFDLRELTIYNLEF
jgi:Cytochrome P450